MSMILTPAEIEKNAAVSFTGRDLTKLTLTEQLELLVLEAELRNTVRMAYFKPYPKQMKFFAMGATFRERLLRAGNQLGKSEAGAYETALHLTGEYPADWPGRRFNHPVRWWCCGETGTLVRDVQQKKLCGPPGLESGLGTGMIPQDCFPQKPTLARGVSNAYDTIFVTHKTNGVVDGVSTCSFKSYEQGREKHQGEPVDGIWDDEEPPMDIYSEHLTRTTATQGMVYITFTPLKGPSEVVRRFRIPGPSRGEVVMTIVDALHIAPARRQQIIDDYPAHEREARVNGEPLLGSGGVFEEVTTSMLSVPLRVVGDEIVHLTLGTLNTQAWAKLWSVDFGIGHPFAATLLAHDRDYDCIYVLAAIKIIGGVPAIHASRMKAIAANVPVAWPHDGNAREKGSGKELARLYKEEGLLMLPSHATFQSGGYSTESGVMDMLTRMRKDQFKVSADCQEWFSEFGSYYRKNGIIVKEYDDLLSATRVGVMTIRSAKAVPLGSRQNKKRRDQVIIDSPLF